MKNRPFLSRLGYALSGVRLAFKEEASFRFQCLAAAGVVVVLVATRPEPVWWALLLLAAALVLAAELANTALERLIDRLHPEVHPGIAAAKDCAAAGVLALSVAAVAVFAAFAAGRLL